MKSKRSVETKPRRIDDYTLQAGTDPDGNGWYVTVAGNGLHTWFLGPEARRIGMAMIKLSYRPKVKTRPTKYACRTAKESK